jgi:hypothetical protein
MSKTPFPISPEKTAIAIAYRNTSLIADEVLPRVPVGTEEFKYLKQTKEESFTIPDTKVGRKSRPNMVDFSATETPAATEDFGLEDFVPQKDIDNAPPAYDPQGRAVEGLTDLIMLDREKRCADLVFALATYPAAQRATLAGTSQWSDFTNSDPVQALLAAMDAMLMKPNTFVFGRAVWSKLSTHPKVVAAALGNASTAGIVSRQRFAEIFEVEKVLVGEPWLNTAKKGQAATMARVWGKHAALLHINKLADTRQGMSFGFTPQFGSRIASTTPDPHRGLRGGVVVRVGESVKELVTASDAGYFYENAVA